MGQASIHFLNKSGNCMFWNSMWDSKINYSNFLKEDEFYKKYVSHLYNDALSMNFFRFKKNKISLKKKLRNRKEFANYTLRNVPIIYSTKIWVLRYQNWVVIYNYIYISKLKKITLKDSASFIDYNKPYFIFNKLYLKKYNFHKKQNKLIF